MNVECGLNIKFVIRGFYYVLQTRFVVVVQGGAGSMPFLDLA